MGAADISPATAELSRARSRASGLCSTGVGSKFRSSGISPSMNPTIPSGPSRTSINTNTTTNTTTAGGTTQSPSPNVLKRNLKMGIYYRGFEKLWKSSGFHAKCDGKLVFRFLNIANVDLTGLHSYTDKDKNNTDKDDDKVNGNNSAENNSRSVVIDNSKNSKNDGTIVKMTDRRSVVIDNTSAENNSYDDSTDNNSYILSKSEWSVLAVLDAACMSNKVAIVKKAIQKILVIHGISITQLHKIIVQSGKSFANPIAK